MKQSIPLLSVVAGLGLAANLLASHFSGKLYTLTLSDSGNLTIQSEHNSGNWAKWTHFDAETQTLYVTDSAVPSPLGVTTFKVGADGSLTRELPHETSLTDGGEVHLALYGGEDGRKFIAFPHYYTSKVVTYQLPLTSDSTPHQTFNYSELAPGPSERQTAAHPHGVHLDPTGRFMFAPDLGADLIHIYAVDSATGFLTQCKPAHARPADGPRHAAFWSPSDSKGAPASMAFSVNELSNTVTVWAVSYPARRGGCLSLTQLQDLSTLPKGASVPSEAKAAEIRVKGDFVYVTNRLDQSFGALGDSIATFKINRSRRGIKESASLRFVELTNAHADIPWAFTINESGDLAAVGGQLSSNVIILERNVTTGQLGNVVANLAVGEVGVPNTLSGLSSVVWLE
ncbi:6-phosphogluconolactonase-like protein [Ilyonectria robusta]